MPSRASKDESKDPGLLSFEDPISQGADGRPLTHQPEAKDTRNPAAVALSKLGASKGGLARAAALSDRKRRMIAKKAAEARWRGKR